MGFSAGSKPGDDLTKHITAASGIDLYGIARRTDSEAVNSLVDQVAEIDALFTSMANSIGVEFDLSGTKLPGQQGDHI